MRRSYTGNEPCPGCGHPASERWRPSKMDVCMVCRERLRLGENIEKYISQQEDYVRFSHHIYAYRNDEVSKLSHELFSSVNSQAMKSTHEYPITGASGSNNKMYCIPKKLYDWAREWFSNLDKRLLEIKKEEDQLPSKIELAIQFAVNQERNKIFNEGVNYGRSLLVQLNSGEITMDKFNEKITKY